MCLRVDKASCTHMSVFLHLMKGPHDDKLQKSGQWPLKGTFTIELLSHVKDIRNNSCNVNFSTATCGNCTSRVVEGNRASDGWGCYQFISIPTDERYLKNETLHFRISYQEYKKTDEILEKLQRKILVLFLVVVIIMLVILLSYK